MYSPFHKMPWFDDPGNRKIFFRYFHESTTLKVIAITMYLHGNSALWWQASIFNLHCVVSHNVKLLQIYSCSRRHIARGASKHGRRRSSLLLYSTSMLLWCPCFSSADVYLAKHVSFKLITCHYNHVNYLSFLFLVQISLGFCFPFTVVDCILIVMKVRGG